MVFVISRNYCLGCSQRFMIDNKETLVINKLRERVPMKIRLLLMFVCCAVHATPWQEMQTSQEIDFIINFMVSPVENVGFCYKGAGNALLPLSYYNTPEYWGEYVCKLPNTDCTVIDHYNPHDYTLKPLDSKKSPGGDLQAERVNVQNGINIYDAACWQIAMAVAAHAGKKSPSGASLYNLAHNVDRERAESASRATTKADGTFTYNGTKITDPSQAYSYRMLSPAWLSKDPFMATTYAKYIQAQNLPDNPAYKQGLVSWMDWKPITGENAWAFLIGPIQAVYLEHVMTGKKKSIPADLLGIQNALGVLTAFKAMQSPIGAIYYATSGSLGNVGSAPVNPYEVSVENNASALAGLLMVQKLLALATPSAEIIKAQTIIEAMLYGDKTTQGLLSFFKNYAWDKKRGLFVQGGIARDNSWTPTLEPRAVDVSTWGVTVLGQPLLDAWFGFGTAYQVWTTTKKWGGFYGPDGQLWGVGYSDQDGNGQHGQGIISAEWTAGAINMLRTLITQYNHIVNAARSPKDQQQRARAIVADLQKDHASMVKNIISLRHDKYTTSKAYSDVRPTNYGQLIKIPDNKLSFLYASKRYFIPFGWFANPLPSTTSTAWIIMLNYNFNPFTLGGSYEANFTAQ